MCSTHPQRSRVGPGVPVVLLAVAFGVGVGCRESSPRSQPETASNGIKIPGDTPTTSGTDDSRPRAVDTGGVKFRDVAGERGLNYSWPAQARPIPILESFGSGCAAFDADNDDWQDLLLVGDPHPALFANRRGGAFDNVTSASGLEKLGADWTGCAIGDYDGDGLQDVLLTGFHRLALCRNLGELRFEDVTAQAGLSSENSGHWGASAGFMDLDQDGWLDLVIVNYVEYGPNSRKYCEYRPGVRSGCTPAEYPPERSEVWRNTGGGRFVAVPAPGGIQDSHGAGMVLAFTDLDGDGKQDFYIGNDGRAADLMYNAGGMRFENIGLASGLAVSETTMAMAAMGADWGDFDRDGRLDLTVTNFQKSSFALFRNRGNRLFLDVAGRTGLAAITKSHLGFGAKWIDFDNDGWPDVVYANGHVYDNAPDVEGAGSTYRQQLSLLRNLSGKRFVDLITTQGDDVRRTFVGRGLATVDFNNDGRVDLLVVDHEGPVALLENETRSAQHWLKLDLRGSGRNSRAYGARVTGRAGDQVWLAEVSPASSYLSSSDPRIHWGLGAASKLDTLEIRWPSGQTQTLADVKGDQIVIVRQD